MTVPIQPAKDQIDEAIGAFAAAAHRDPDLARYELLALALGRVGLGIDGGLLAPAGPGTPLSDGSTVDRLVGALVAEGAQAQGKAREPLGAFLERNVVRPRRYLVLRAPNLVAVAALEAGTRLAAFDDFVVEESVLYCQVVRADHEGTTLRFDVAGRGLELFVG